MIKELKYEFIVVGGGLSGVCSAIASARKGIKTALIQNRPVLGGNASSEIRMHICGADYHASRDNARETGIVEEILLRNKEINPQHSNSILDTVLWEKVKFQKNLTLYLNTHLSNVKVEKNKIIEIECFQLTTEKKFLFTSELFADTTGDCTLAYLAGAEYMSGKEGENKFGENLAPVEAEKTVMGSSLLFQTRKYDKKVEFKKPFWANTYTEKDLKFRDHVNFDFGYWWIELGGDELNTITDNEEIRDELLKAVYGVWDHIKNCGSHGAENYALEWVGFLPGKRESRRIVGDYILKESDILNGNIFEDAIAYGGWPMDIHATGGLKNKKEPTTWNEVNGLYTIPYRSIYSKNIKNLYVGGRGISASHIAFSSTRVMATCGIIGQAIGTAAAFAIKNQLFPVELLPHIKKVQNELMRDDCYILGHQEYNNELLKDSKIVASSFLKGYEPKNVINGFQRNINEDINMWSSNDSDSQPWIEITLEKVSEISEISLVFDSNLSKEIMTTSVTPNRKKQRDSFPVELVKDYKISLYDENDSLVFTKKIENNIYRLNNHSLNKLKLKKIKLTILSTHGSKNANVFEIKLYN